MHSRVDIHRYQPLEFSVVQTNKHGVETRHGYLAYWPTLRAAISDARHWAGQDNVIVTDAAREAGYTPTEEREHERQRNIDEPRSGAGGLPRVP